MRPALSCVFCVTLHDWMSPRTCPAPWRNRYLTVSAKISLINCKVYSAPDTSPPAVLAGRCSPSPRNSACIHWPKSLLAAALQVRDKTGLRRVQAILLTRQMENIAFEVLAFADSAALVCVLPISVRGSINNTRRPMHSAQALLNSFSRRRPFNASPSEASLVAQV